MAKTHSATHSRASYNDLTAYNAMMPHIDRYLAMLEADGYGNDGYGKKEYGEKKGGYTQLPFAPQGMPYGADAAVKLGIGIGVGYAMAMRGKYGKDGGAEKHCPTCSCGSHAKAGGLESKLGYKSNVTRNQPAKSASDDKYGYN